MPHDRHLIEPLEFLSRLFVAMMFGLRLAKFLQHSHFAVGGDQRFAALGDFVGDHLPLLIGRLMLDLENHFVARRIGKKIDVHRPGRAA